MSQTSQGGSTELRGDVLEVLSALLEEGRDEAIVALVAQLVARNGELERRIAEMMAPRKSREGVSSAQLRLLLDELAAQDADADGADDGAADGDDDADATDPRGEANQNLRELSAPDDRDDDKTPERAQPALRRPIPPNLRRVDNPLPVPAEDRPCPDCGAERT